MAYPVQTDPTAVFGRRVLAALIDAFLIFVPVIMLATSNFEYYESDAPQVTDGFCEQYRDATDGVCVEVGDRVYFSDDSNAGATALLISATVTGAMIGVAIGAWTPVIVGLAAIGYRRAHAPSRRPLLREALAGTHTLFAFYVLCNFDAVIARNRLDAHDAGLYAAGLILTKAALMAPSFVGVLLYPRFATDETAASLRSPSASPAR